MFENWNDDRFAIWLAGFFDGEGCVYLPPSGVGVEVSIAGTCREAIESIHRRIGFGIVTEIRFENVGGRWKTKYHWRVRNYPHAHRVLTLLLPHLTIKADVAARALERIAPNMARREAMERRNNEMRRLRAEGMTQREIGERFRISTRSVQQVLYREGLDPWEPRRETDGRFCRRAVQRHIKTPADPKTTAVVVAG